MSATEVNPLAIIVSRLILIVAFAIPLATLFGCGTDLPPPEAAADASQRLEEAKERIQQVAEWIDAAQRAAEATPALLEAAQRASDAYEAERYSDATSALRDAVKALREAGVEVPDDVPTNLARAELLLLAVGK